MVAELLIRLWQRAKQGRHRSVEPRFRGCGRAAGARRWRLRSLEPLEDRWLLALPAVIHLEPIADFASPVVATHAHDGSGRMFVAEQGGRIAIVRGGQAEPTPFLDISSRLVTGGASGERGLLGLAFHPDYAMAGAAGKDRFFVYYSAPALSGGDHDSVIAEYRVSSANPDVADFNSERIMMRFSQPFSNHNGGDLQFGPDDGFLYISSGDGGSGGDPQNNAQNRSNLLGAILRVDVDGNNGPAGAYGIPASNPFVGQPGVREEIFAYGFRNPFRISLDDGNGGAATADRLFVGDVGQNAWEEVDLVVSGGNYGWRIREGAHPFNTSDADPGNLIDPIAEYPNPAMGRSVIGGYVYRGMEYPALRGTYLFGDLNGTLLALQEKTGGTWELSQPLVDGGNPIGSGIIGFGQDPSGELYVLTFTSMLAIEFRFPWQNPVDRFDVDESSLVDRDDALDIIGYLRSNAPRELPVSPAPPNAPPPFFDVDPNGLVEPIDALLIIGLLLSPATAPPVQAAAPSEAEADSTSSLVTLLHETATIPRLFPQVAILQDERNVRSEHLPRNDVSGAFQARPIVDVESQLVHPATNPSMSPAVAQPPTAAHPSVPSQELLEELLPLLAADVARARA